MSQLAATDAAAALGVDPNTLAEWRERYGFPEPSYENDESYYDASMIEALQDAVKRELSLPRAIAVARIRAG